MSRSERQPHDPLLAACRDLTRAMDLFDEAACSVLGLGRSDLRALNLLEHGPLSASTLASRLGLTKSAVTALIDRLSDAGYVTRVAVPGDRRATGIVLQPATWEAFARVYRPLGARVSAAAAGMAERDRRAAVDAMTAMITAFDEVRAGLTGDASAG